MDWTTTFGVIGGLIGSMSCLIVLREHRKRYVSASQRETLKRWEPDLLGGLREAQLQGTPIRTSYVVPDDRAFVTKGEIILSPTTYLRLKESLDAINDEAPKTLLQRWQIKIVAAIQHATQPFRRY